MNQQLSSALASIVGLLLVLVEKVSAQNCTGVVCNNGGICNSFTASPPCICPLPYIPPYCSAAANYCNTLQPEKGITALPVCLNGGNCTMAYTDPYFNCTCPTDFSGFRCNDSKATTVSTTTTTSTPATTTAAAVVTSSAFCISDCSTSGLTQASIIAISVCVPVVLLAIAGTLIYVCCFKKDSNRVGCKPSGKANESLVNIYSREPNVTQYEERRNEHHSSPGRPIDETPDAQRSNDRDVQVRSSFQRRTDEAQYARSSNEKENGKNTSAEHPTDKMHSVDESKGRPIYGELPTLMSNLPSGNDNLGLEKIPSDELQSVEQEVVQKEVKKKRRRKRHQQPLQNQSVDLDALPGDQLPTNGAHGAGEPEATVDHSPPMSET